MAGRPLPAQDRYLAYRPGCVDAGQIDSPLSADELGACFVALLDGLQLQWLYNAGAVQPAATLRTFLASVIPGLHGQA